MGSAAEVPGRGPQRFFAARRRPDPVSAPPGTPPAIEALGEIVEGSAAVGVGTQLERRPGARGLGDMDNTEQGRQGIVELAGDEVET